MSGSLAEVPASTHLRCHSCSRFLGETLEPLQLEALVRGSCKNLLALVPAPRDTRLCPACGWINVFRRGP